MKSKRMKKIMGRRRNGEGCVVRRSDGRYQASRMFNGDRKFYYSWDENECYRWLDELKAKQIQGMPITDANVKFEDYAASYIERYAAPYVKPATLKNYQGYLVNYIVGSNIGKLKIDRVYADHIQDFVNEHMEKGKSPKTIANIMSFTESVFAQAVRSRLIFSNPCDGVRLPKKKSKERPLITEEEYAKLLAVAESQTMRTGIAILGEGLRIGEMLGLQWGDLQMVDDIPILNINKALKREYIFDEAVEKKNGTKTEVRITDTKSESSVRQVPLTKGVLNELEKLKSEQMALAGELGIKFTDDIFIIGSVGKNGFVFMTQDKFRKEFAICVERAGLPKKVTPHALRKYTASTLIRHGASPVAVARLLGHSSSSTTLNYYSRENLRGTLDAVKLLDK